MLHEEEYKYLCSLEVGQHEIETAWTMFPGIQAVVEKHQNKTKAFDVQVRGSSPGRAVITIRKPLDPELFTPSARDGLMSRIRSAKLGEVVVLEVESHHLPYIRSITSVIWKGQARVKRTDNGCEVHVGCDDVDVSKKADLIYDAYRSAMAGTVKPFKGVSRIYAHNVLREINHKNGTSLVIVMGEDGLFVDWPLDFKSMSQKELQAVKARVSLLLEETELI